MIFCIFLCFQFQILEKNRKKSIILNENSHPINFRILFPIRTSKIPLYKTLSTLHANYSYTKNIIKRMKIVEIYQTFFKFSVPNCARWVFVPRCLHLRFWRHPIGRRCEMALPNRETIFYGPEESFSHDLNWRRLTK